LLTAGADINAKNGHGGTPLHTAVWNANEDVSKLLLARGAKLDIFTMAGLGLKDRLALLLDKDRKLVDAKDPEERTPLHWAACTGQRAIVELLIARGANVSARARWDDTPLHHAARYGRDNVIELLLKHRADVGVKNSSGRTPLHEAVYRE